MLDDTKANVALRRLRAAQHRDGVVPLEGRRRALKALRGMVVARADDLVAAVARDFGGRSPHETRVSEIAMALAAVDHALPRLKRWSRPERVSVGWRFWPARAQVLKQPVGVAGIIAPWNYPVQLALLPLVGALAAGCRVVVKPSEHVPETAGLLCRSLAEHFDPDLVLAIEGGASDAAAMAAAPFDKLLFTGSTATGRAVLRAAADNLVPTVLELGGKSPAIVDASADVARAAADIVAGKLLNAGQTCVATDYAFVPRASLDAFVAEARASARRLYPDPDGADYSAICRPADRARLLALCEGHRTVPLFDRELAPPKLTPALVLAPDLDSALMREEIFGPLLPVFPYDDIEEVFAALRDRPDPLALYWFGSDRARRDDVLARTRSGGVAVNDTIMHVAVEALPLGGLGASGMGAYHGRSGFEAFTHRRAVFIQSRWSPTRLLRPPYGALADRIGASMVK